MVTSVPASLRSREDFPRWMRLMAFFVGLLSLGDAIRKFFMPRPGEPIAGAFAVFLVGAACLFITGYSRQIVLDEEGLSRETNLWGRKNKTCLLALGDFRQVLLRPIRRSPKELLAHVGSDLKTYRFPLSVSDRQVFLSWLEANAPTTQVLDLNTEPKEKNV